MHHKNSYSGLIALLTLFLLFCCLQVRALNFNEEERHLLHTLPIFDQYGIAGELSVEEVDLYKRDTDTNEIISTNYWYEAITRIPYWTKDARYCDCFDIPVFANLKAYNSALTVQVRPSVNLSEGEISLSAISDYSYKEFTTSRASIPKLPTEYSNISEEIITILLGTNPIMLREFDTDSYPRWSWVDNLMGSWFENQPIKIMPHANPKVLKLNIGDHYRMALIMDDNDKPEAILLDDAQGAYLRKFYNALLPVYYLENIWELPHHAIKIIEFGALALLAKEISILQHKHLPAMHQATPSITERVFAFGFMIHNLIEFSGHLGHLQVVQKGWRYFNPPGEDKQKKRNEHEPDYVLGTMDAANLASTGAQIGFQMRKGSLTLLDNTNSLAVGMINLGVSANHQSLTEYFDERIDEMIHRYFKNNYRKLYLDSQGML